MSIEIVSQKNKILITGGSGFIGTNLVESHIQTGDTVLNLDSTPPRNKAHQKYWSKIDLLNPSELENAIRKFDPEYIYHMAARTDLDGKSLDSYGANTTGVSNVIRAANSLKNLRRIIFASSRLVCRIGYQPKDEFDCCPTTFYGESKVIGENIVRERKGLPCTWIIVRPTSIWGPWFDIPYKTFFLTISRGHYVHPGNRTIEKSFGFIGNSVYQLRKLMYAPGEKVDGKTYFLEDYPPINVHEMAEYIRQTMGAKPIRTAPLAILRIGAVFGDMLKIAGWRNPPLTSFRLNNLITNMVYDSTELESIVGELPYTMQRGIAETVEWMRVHGEI